MKRVISTCVLLVTVQLWGAGVIWGQSSISMTTAEQPAMSDALQYALEYNKTNQSAYWVNPDNSSSGAVTPTYTYIDVQGRPCREFSTDVKGYDGRQRGHGTACRLPDGFWYVFGDDPPPPRAAEAGRTVHVYTQPERYYYSAPCDWYNPFNIVLSFGYLFPWGHLHVSSRNHGRPDYHYWHDRKHNIYPYYRQSSRHDHHSHFHRGRHR